jgi:hypothetical protein
MKYLKILMVILAAICQELDCDADEKPHTAPVPP